MLNFKSKLNKIFTLILLLGVNQMYSKVIIWDLGDTLVKADQFAMAGQIGIGKLFLHALIDWKNPMDIKDQIFDVFNLLEKNSAREFIPTYKDKNLPELICKWLEGKKSGCEIYKELDNFMDKNPDEGFFVSNRHKKIIKNGAKAIFNPRKLAHNLKPISSTVKLLEKCAKNNHKIIIFSNFDAKTFGQLKKLKRNKRLFKNVKPENIMISGRTGLLKPDPKAYQFLIDKYNLDPQDCVMIDDQLANIKAAEKFGISAIHFEGSRKLEKELKSRKLI